MSFELQIEFTGLFLYLARPDGRYTVLMPDCRDKAVSAQHEDGHKGVAHAGYVRVDAAALGLNVPAGSADTPQFEVVHRLSGQEVHLSGLTAGAVGGAPALPRFEAPYFVDMALRRDTLTETPRDLLMRLELTGGRFVAGVAGHQWSIPATLGSEAAPQVGAYASSVLWTTTMGGDTMEVLLRAFGTSPADAPRLSLRCGAGDEPRVVSIRIANLCAQNPLEWDSLELAETDRDLDFKWLYRLVESTSGSFKSRLQSSCPPTDVHFPFPTLSGGVPRSNQGCMGVTMRAAY